MLEVRIARCAGISADAAVDATGDGAVEVWELKERPRDRPIYNFFGVELFRRRRADLWSPRHRVILSSLSFAVQRPHSSCSIGTISPGFKRATLTALPSMRLLAVTRVLGPSSSHTSLMAASRSRAHHEPTVSGTQALSKNLNNPAGGAYVIGHDGGPL